MKFTRLATAIAFTLVFGASVIADESIPVCGIMQSPPCAMAQVANDDATTPLDNPMSSTDASGIFWSEATLDIAQTLLTIF